INLFYFFSHNNNSVGRDAMKLDKDSLRINLEETEKESVEFIRGVVDGSGASGVVIGLSGGVDSSLAAALCVRALGRDRVLGVLMPTDFTPKDDVEDALQLADMLGIRTEIVNVQGILDAFLDALQISRDSSEFRLPRANILARIRMVILYYYANINGYLVAGTGDKSETLIGYFTKYGDGAADFFPNKHLYKTQVRELAQYAGVPEKIAYKPSSPQLYPGHKATDEIPIDYDKLDLILVGLFDYKMTAQEVSVATGISLETVMEVQDRYDKTKHKRVSPPTIER
ncbi:MAG: NAD+ synthase, partial [Candidatus Bathyarchaeia archaeon]